MAPMNTLVATWNRALSAAEIKSVRDNPWQIFPPPAQATRPPLQPTPWTGRIEVGVFGTSITENVAVLEAQKMKNQIDLQMLDSLSTRD